MKKVILISLGLLFSAACFAQQTIPRPDVCKACVMDTTGGYVSIDDTLIHNPICNYEHLTAAHLVLVHQLKLHRDTILFWPNAIHKLYNNCGDDAGHVIAFEDLAWSWRTAKASMNTKRNLAPQPHLENVGTKYACEQLTRALATQYGAVDAWGGTYGSVGNVKGINKPAIYWTVIVTPAGTKVFWMPTTGDKISLTDINDPAITITYQQLITYLGFDPERVLSVAALKTI
jgi:DNA/RNA endonuclease G (NUC1)